ncbi:cupin domain-containing protein [Kitasatospora sp. NPDC098652]|uniref:cupin domain-containing protein n=1 Tax=Kitasatospora sp. NPDC098652 TaxID=3364095 RepID=UPI0037FAAA5C
MPCGTYRLDHGPGHPLMRELPPVVHLPAHSPHHPQLRPVIAPLNTEPAAEQPGGQLAAAALVDLLPVHLLRARTTRPGAEGPGRGTARPRGRRGTGLRTHRPGTGLEHQEPCPPAPASPAPPSTTAPPPLTGRTPTTHLTWWRTTRAAALPRRGTDPLEPVARTVGHTGPHTLPHAFAREFATTPGRHRTTTTPANRHPDNTPTTPEAFTKITTSSRSHGGWFDFLTPCTRSGLTPPTPPHRRGGHQGEAPV